MECHRGFGRCSIEVTKSCSWYCRDSSNQLIWRISQFSQGFIYNSLWLRQKKINSINSMIRFFPQKILSPTSCWKGRSWAVVQFVGAQCCGEREKGPQLLAKFCWEIFGQKNLSEHLIFLDKKLLSDFCAPSFWRVSKVCVFFRHSKNSSLFGIHACWFRIWICVVFFQFQLRMFFLSLISSQIISCISSRKKSSTSLFSRWCRFWGNIPPKFDSSAPEKKKTAVVERFQPFPYLQVAKLNFRGIKSVLERYFFPRKPHTEAHGNSRLLMAGLVRRTQVKRALSRRLVGHPKR